MTAEPLIYTSGSTSTIRSIQPGTVYTVGPNNVVAEHKSDAIDKVLPTARQGNGVAKLPDTMPKDKGPARNLDNTPLEKGDAVLLVAIVMEVVTEDKGQTAYLALSAPPLEKGGPSRFIETIQADRVYAKLNKEQCELLGIELKGDE